MTSWRNCGDRPMRGGGRRRRLAGLARAGYREMAPGDVREAVAYLAVLEELGGEEMDRVVETRRPRRFSVGEYHRMGEAGILKEDERVELLEGAILELARISPGRAICVDRLNEYWPKVLKARASVSVRNPVSLDPYSEPQPDVGLLLPPLARYSKRHPGPEDLFLVIEVADTTTEYDRTRKIPLYGRAGVRETWLVDLATHAVEVYRVPGPDGYGSVRTFGQGQILTPEAFPDIRLPVDDILG